MQVMINGKSFTFNQKLSIEQLLLEMQISQTQGIAVALNDDILPKTKLSETYIKDGDKLEIIHATAGG